MNKYTQLKDALTTITYLQANDIDPILFGSLGVSLYLGHFKDFGDIDLLVEGIWLHEKWEHLLKILAAKGFILLDEHEHEFKNSAGIMVAFAEDTVLTRDKILSSLDEVIRTTVAGVAIRTLSAATFKKAYLFSEKDGYRKNTRGKKDHHVVELLDDYLAQA